MSREENHLLTVVRWSLQDHLGQVLKFVRTFSKTLGHYCPCILLPFPGKSKNLPTLISSILSTVKALHKLITVKNLHLVAIDAHIVCGLETTG